MKQFEPVHFYVIMPVYNVEKYIEQSVRSILSQTYDNYHLIMVDDGSLDSSGAICDMLAAEDARLICIHQKNQGQIAARMTAIAEAHRISDNKENEYVLFLDSDDWLERHAMETIAFNLSHTECDCLIYGFQRVLDGEIVYSTPEEKVEGVIPLKEAYRKICMDNVYNSLWRKAIRLKAIPMKDYSEYYHIRLGEDLLQTLDIMRQVKTIGFITEHLYNYRVNSESMTESINYEKFDFDYTVSKSLLKFLCDNDVHTDDSWILQWKIFSERLYSDIMKLLFSNHSWHKKRKWLEKIISSNYVQTELAPRIPYEKLPKNKRVVLRNALKRKYTILRLYYILTKMRNRNS